MKPHTEIGKSLQVWWVSHDNVAVHSCEKSFFYFVEVRFLNLNNLGGKGSHDGVKK